MGRTVTRQGDVGDHVGGGAGEEAERGCGETAAGFGFVDEVEGQGGDQHPGSERHHGCDDALRYAHEPGDRSADDESATSEQAP